MQIPTGGPSPFVAPPKPAPFSFSGLVEAVGRLVAPPPPPPPAADRGGPTGAIARPTDPGAPIAAPAGGGLAQALGGLAGRLLGRPLSPASEMKLAMDLAGGAGPVAAVKALVRTPEVAQGLASRALGLVAGGQVSRLLPGGLGAKLIAAKDAFKAGGIIGALKALKGDKASVAKLPAPPPPQVPAGGTTTPALQPLSTVPHLPRYAACKLDVSNPEQAVVQAATWVRENFPEVFGQYNQGVFNPDGAINKQAERRNGHELSTHVIGVLRANGLDVSRVVRHPDQPVGSPGRYVNDALALPDGRNIDFYGGEDNTPQFHDLGAEARRAPDRE